MRLLRAALADFEAVIRAFAAGLAEAERLDEESLLFVDLPDRQHGAVEAADWRRRADLGGRPAGSRVALASSITSIEQSGGMMEADECFWPNRSCDAAVFDLVPVEMIDPELQRTLRHGVDGGLNLAGTRAPWHALVRKRRHDRADLCVRVGVVEVIVRRSGRRTAPSA